MRLITGVTAALALCVAMLGYSKGAEAAHVVVGVGIGIPGVAVVAPAALPVAPGPYYYAPPVYPAYYAPGVVAVGPYWRGGHYYYGRHFVGHRGWR